ncbi:MAG: hypothetical protein NTY93_01045 [Candidatus Kaiserbacteria bacterium]|nr:hypothetical protein [Candidatus Kaiserbacteria bacterium]
MNEQQKFFHITVDYRQLLEEMIDVGCYDWTNDEITTEFFPIEGKGIVEFEFHCHCYDSFLSSEEVIEKIKRENKRIEQENKGNPWSPGKIEHLLSLGASFPNEQCNGPIVGLGSIATVYGIRGVKIRFGELPGSLVVPGLRKNGSRRILGLDRWKCSWPSATRFLIVRGVSTS